MKTLIAALTLMIGLMPSYADKTSPLLQAVHEVEANVKEPDRAAILAFASRDPLVIERYKIDGEAARMRLRSWILEHWALNKASDFRAYFEDKGIKKGSTIAEVIINAWVSKAMGRKIQEDALISWPLPWN